MSTNRVKSQTSKKTAILVGVGRDNDDGHKRVTQGDGIVILGGSQKTHEIMTETTIKTMEKLKAKGKDLRTVDPRELAEILHESTPRE